jgi:hypothetical protein
MLGVLDYAVNPHKVERLWALSEMMLKEIV